jgi:hypothetical protein
LLQLSWWIPAEQAEYQSCVAVCCWQGRPYIFKGLRRTYHHRPLRVYIF